MSAKKTYRGNLCKKRGFTERGFGFVEFEDYNGEKCSLQQSSLATKSCVWLGVDRYGRMHLSVKHAKMLVEELQKFIKENN